MHGPINFKRQYYYFHCFVVKEFPGLLFPE